MFPARKRLAFILHRRHPCFAAAPSPPPYDHTSSSTDYDYDPIGNLTSLAGTTLDYEDGSHKHAATHRNGSPAYTYDANGNMVTRVDGSTTYTQAFDVENRLKTVTLSGSTLTTNFAYDASGQRLRTETGPSGSPVANNSRTITTYPFPGYEVEQRYRWMELCPSEDNCTWGWGNTATITRKTYFLGGQAIATRITGDPTNNGFFYLHSDHLGSSSLLTYGNGQASPGDKVNGTETRYYPYGSHRLTPTTQLTERDFTGQRENLELGLVYYNARFYVPGLGRFLTADTIVPDPARPQAYNRYAYVLNNPVAMIDPSGHGYVDAPQGAGGPCGVTDGPMGGTPCALIAVNVLGAANAAQSEEFYEMVTLPLLSVICEACDWMFTAGAWLRGDFHPLDLLGLLPLMTSSSRRIISSADDWVTLSNPRFTWRGFEFRSINLNFAPNSGAMAKMNDIMGEMARDYTYCNRVDCSEIARYLYKASDGNGYIIRIGPQDPSKMLTIKTPEAGGNLTSYMYHEVYTDGRYVFDPTLSSTPLALGDYMTLIKGLNPDALVTTYTP